MVCNYVKYWYCIVVNLLLCRDGDETKLGLLWVLLALIFMNEGTMTDGKW